MYKKLVVNDLKPKRPASNHINSGLGLLRTRTIQINSVRSGYVSGGNVSRGSRKDRESDFKMIVADTTHFCKRDGATDMPLFDGIRISNATIL